MATTILPADVNEQLSHIASCLFVVREGLVVEGSLAVVRNFRVAVHVVFLAKDTGAFLFSNSARRAITLLHTTSRAQHDIELCGDCHGRHNSRLYSQSMWRNRMLRLHDRVAVT